MFELLAADARFNDDEVVGFVDVVDSVEVFQINGNDAGCREQSFAVNKVASVTLVLAAAGRRRIGRYFCIFWSWCWFGRGMLVLVWLSRALL